MIQAPQVSKGDNVLVIGAATGYGTAILAKLAGSVIAVETRTQMVEKAQETSSRSARTMPSPSRRLTEGFAAAGALVMPSLSKGAVETVPEPF